MKHLTKQSLLTMLVAFVSLTVSAYDFEVDGLYYTILSAGDLTCEVVAGNKKYSGDIIIPATVTYNEQTFCVTSIGDYTFYCCRSLTSIEIPNSVTSVGDSTFYWCRSLSSIEIPNSVISIGDYAFYKCENLTSIEIPNSVTNIGDEAFYDCYHLTSIEIPNSVTNIGFYAFNGCKELSSVYIKDLSAWCKINFVNCESNPLFNDNAKLYLNNQEVTNLVLPNDITSIGNYAFCGYGSLTSIEISNSVISIGNYAFEECRSLTSIEIPNSVTSIGDGAFKECRELSAVYIKDLSAWCKINFSSWASNPLAANRDVNSKETDGTKLYLNNQEVKDLVIPNDITSIGNYAFGGCTSITSVEMPNGITSIGQDSFYLCSSLTSIEMPNSLTSIGVSSFAYCSNLTSVEIPNSVTSIGGGAFRNCSNLTSVEIPNSVTSIGGAAFYGCSCLTSVEIPNSVTKIEEYTFYDCEGLISIKIGNGITVIGEGAFRGCMNLSTVEVGNNYGAKEMMQYASVLIIAEDYIDASMPNIKYSNYDNLTKIMCKLATPPTLYDTFSLSQYQNLRIIVPTSSLALYQSASVWEEFYNLKGGAEEYMSDVNDVLIEKNNAPTAIYDLQGRRLKAPQKGLNIINGKKVVVK